MDPISEEEYARVAEGFAKGRFARVQGKVYTSLADLDADLGQNKPPDPPANPREGRQRDLAKQLKPALVERATALGLATDGTKEELAAAILDAEFPDDGGAG